MSLVDAVAVESVIEARDVCADVDAARARAALADALASSRAPRRSPNGQRWTVTVRVSRLSTGAGRTADATIVDDRGTVVSERTLADRDAKACAPIARAIGAWATLVIDAELDRAHDPPPAEVAAESAAVTTTTTSAARDPSTGRVLAEGDDADRGTAGEPRTGTEIGGAMYLRSGIVSASLAGFAPYASFELGQSWRLRPSIAFGHGTSARESHVAAAVEACRRIPGNYSDRRGLSADLCAALRGGTVFSDWTANDNTYYIGVAPVIALRGDIGAGLSGEVRGSVGTDVASRLYVSSEAQIGISGVLP